MTSDSLDLNVTIKDDIEKLSENTCQIRCLLLDEKDKKVLKWLSPIDPSINHICARKKHAPTTGNWFLQSPQFLTWKESTNTSLWIQGKPGAGKTILCSTIIDEIAKLCDPQKSSDQHAYFYFDFNIKWNTVDMLRSIIAQLCSQRGEIPKVLEEWYQKCAGGQRQPDLDALFEIFSAVLTTSNRTFLVLDALDECSVGSEREDLLESIEKMTSISTAHLNLLVTSRKVRDIQIQLDPQISVKMDLENLVDSDIQIYVTECLRSDKNLRKWDVDIKQKIQEALLKHANGMYSFPSTSLLIGRFRWVECQLISLRRCRSVRALENALAQLPKDLDATYQHILAAIPEEEQCSAHRALQLVLVSFRPLTIKEVSWAITVNIDTGKEDPKMRLRDPLDILEICCGLIEAS